MLLLLSSHDSCTRPRSHKTRTQRGEGCVLVIKQGLSWASTNTQRRPEGKGAGLAWYLIVTAVSHWQCELIYQRRTWTIWTQAHAAKPYVQTHLFAHKQRVIGNMYRLCWQKLEYVKWDIRKIASKKENQHHNFLIIPMIWWIVKRVKHWILQKKTQEMEVLRSLSGCLSTIKQLFVLFYYRVLIVLSVCVSFSVYDNGVYFMFPPQKNFMCFLNWAAEKQSLIYFLLYM